ncbi:unnamed protein product [Kluyveromyces dobzhanskii CBS 2104]|uniref:Nucleoporin NUP188 n=1 Tax=Kluyveromyces dobzhanskii CBS 2104 TaxID=1427455 RepID=A0A0A8L991_9SACH|nr:unnamed protein product [Kluyveromyces dobzhanskii CBS 2104]
MSSLSFAGICAFLRSGEYDNVHNEPTFQAIDKFLRNNEEILVHLSRFTTVETTAPVGKQLQLRGYTYNISGDDEKLATELSDALNVGKKECLRVISQTQSRFPDCSMQKDTVVKQILHERNCVLDIALLLLNHDSFPVLKDSVLQLIHKNRSTIFSEAILLLRGCLSQIGSAEDQNCYRESLLSYGLIYITNLLNLIAYISLNQPIGLEIITKWYELLHETHYFAALKDNKDVPSEIYDMTNSLMIMDTILITGYDSSQDAIDVKSSFFNNAETFRKLLDTIINTEAPAIIVYYWSFVLYSKSYLLEELPEQNLEFVQQVFQSQPISELIKDFALTAENENVFEEISKVSFILKDQAFFSAILTSIVTFSLYFVPINLKTSKMIKAVLNNAPTQYVEKFLTNKEFERKLFLIKSKLPLMKESLIPMINLTSVHPEFAHFEWKELTSYVQQIVLGSLEYDLADDAGSTDLISMKKDTFARVPLEPSDNVLLPIPKETKAKILPSATDDDIVMFLYKYNGWSLLGRVLQNACDRYTSTSSMTDQDDDVREVILSLLDLVSSIIGNSISIEKSTDILQQLSTYVTEDYVFDVVSRIFEQSLHLRDHNVIDHCLELLINSTDNFSQFVWSHLARSELLDRYGKSGLISSVLGTVELPNGNYSITIKLIKLTQRLVLESLTLPTEFPENLKKEILSKFIQHFIHVYESYQYWNYCSLSEKYELGANLTKLFTTVIYSIYGIDPANPPETKITRVLSSAANHLTTRFLSSDSPDIRTVSSLMHVLLSSNSLEALSIGNEVFFNKYNQCLLKSFDLANMLVSIRAMLQLPPSTLESQIYSNLPKFIDIYGLHNDLRNPIIKLMTHLVRAPWADNFPSLLSYLGQTHSKMIFNSFLYDLESEIDDYQFLKSLYRFFSSVMEGKQDGFSILLVTGEAVSVGSSPKKSQSSNKSSEPSILSLLKKNVLKLDSYPESVASRLLEAISYAFNSWAAARNNTADKEFIDFLVGRLEKFEEKSAPDSIEATIKISSHYRLQARIAEIFALHLFTASPSDSTITKMLNGPQLSNIVKRIFSIDGYDKTLHTTLAREFKKIWPHLELEKFAISPLYRIGKAYQANIYDIELLDQFFCCDDRWVGNGASPGFREQVIKSSINLQFVSFQISATKSWGALLTAFIKKTPKPLQPSYIEIVTQLLALNVEYGVEAPIFSEIYLLRIELVFYILYSLLQTSTVVPENKLETLLSQFLAILKSKEVNYLGNVSQSNKNNEYRPLLRSVLILLTLAKSYPMFSEKCSDCILELFELSFSKGVNLILSVILSSFTVTSTKGKKVVVPNIADKIQDLLLLLSLFTKIKDLNTSTSFNTVLASSLNEFGTLKSLLNLYYSSYLFKSNDEPLFAELTLSFISELVTVEEVAQKIIDNGLFSVLLESPISVSIQQSGVRPDVSPRLHNIWSNGIISIVLQLLSKFGSSILSEVCLFVSYFSKQVDLAVAGWSSDSLWITQAYIQETSQIILLQKMLGKLEYQRYLSVNGSVLKIIDEEEIIELFPGLDTSSERKDLANVLRHLLTHPKYMNSRIIATTPEKQKMMNDEVYRNQLLNSITKQISELQTSLISNL